MSKKIEILLAYKDFYFEDIKEYLQMYLENMLDLEIITKEQAKQVKDVEDLSDVWLTEEAFYERVNDIKIVEWDSFIEEMEEKFKSWTYIVDATTQTRMWNRYYYEAHSFNSFEDILQELAKWDYMYVAFDVYKNWNIEFVWVHHDWKNTRTFTPIENLTKKELIEFIEDKEDDIERLKEEVKDVYEKPFSKLNKEELIEVIENYY